MKNTLLLLSFVVISFMANAQCVPEASTNQQGVYPSELEQYCLLQPYADTLTVVYPIDTLISGFTVAFDSFRVDIVNNLPNGVSYECDHADCMSYPSLPSPARGCVNLLGSPISASQADSIELSITAWATFFGNVYSVSDIIQKVKLPYGGNPSTAWSYDPPSSLTVNFYNNTSGATSTDWDFGDGSTSSMEDPVHTFASAGTYTVCLSTSTPCGDDMACLQIMVDNTVGIEETVMANAQLFPNPTSGALTIELSEMMGSVQCRLTNATGQLCLDKVFTNTDRIALDMNVEPALYLLELIDAEGNRAAFQVVKQ